MENIHLNYYYRVIYFSQQDITSETKLIANRKYSLSHIDKQFIDDLYGIILRAKGDWVDLELNIFNRNYYLDIYLVYQNEFTTRDKAKNNQVIKTCEEYFRLKSADKFRIDYNNAENLSEILEGDGFIINIVEEDGSGILDYNDVNEIFIKNHIHYKVLNINQYRRECGASMGAEDILYFIAAASISGITWDVIKNIYDVKIKPNSDAIKLYIFDNFSFKRMRKIMANRIGEKENNIILYKMIKEGNKIQLLFRIDNKRINVETDNKYNIINLRMKDQ